MKQNSRFKSYPLWVAIGSLIVMIANDFFGIAAGDTERYVDLLLGILIAGGVINNPSIGQGISDKNKY